MQLEFLVNKEVSLLLSPENEMEEQLLKQLFKQENDIHEIRSSVIVVNKSYNNGILITKKPAKKVGPEMVDPEDESK